MDTRVLPIGRTYTGSNRASANRSAASFASAPAVVAAPVLSGSAGTVSSVPVARVSSAPAAPVTCGSGGPVVVYQQVTPTNSAAIVSLVLSLISFVSSAFFLGFVGIIFGHISRSQIKRRGERGNGMAVAGLWLGYLSVIFWIGFWLVYFGVIALLIGVGVAAESGAMG